MSGRVLVITAHPDDAEFHFGATIARLVDEGYWVGYVVATDGDRGLSRDGLLSVGSVGIVRCGEQKEAAALLGVRHLAFLGLPDGSVAATPDLRKAIVAELRRHRPTLVITHYPRRVLGLPLEASHPDHLAVGEAVLAAVYPDASNARAFPELIASGLEPHRVREVWLPGYEHPDHYVDATPYLKRKIDAIGCHRSQLDGSGAPEWLYAWMREVGRASGHEYSESFTRIHVD